MRVLMTGRRVLVLAASVALAATILPASAEAVAPASAHQEGSHQPSVAVDSTSAVSVDEGTGVALGPAVKYVRLADGTVQRIR